MIWNETKEKMSRDEMTALQSVRLVKLVDYVYHNVEFYRKKMQAKGLLPGDIKGLEDITKLPFTTLGAEVVPPDTIFTALHTVHSIFAKSIAIGVPFLIKVPSGNVCLSLKSLTLTSPKNREASLNFSFFKFNSHSF